MNLQDDTKEYINDYVEMRVSHSRQTDDAMHNSLHREIQGVKEELGTIKDVVVCAVTEAVKITVNGKIDRIKMQLDEQDKMLKKIGLDTIPAVTTFDWLMTGGKAVMWLCAAIASVGGAIFMIIKLIEWTN